MTARGDGEPGRTTFTNVTKDGPRTHKATNVGPTPFHNISFILKNREPAGTAVSDRSGVAGYTQIMDNARIRAWRVVLKPGEATGQITQTAAGLRVYVHGGVVAEMVPGSADRGMAPYEGDFIWQDAGQTRAVKNTGTALIEFVEFCNRFRRHSIFNARLIQTQRRGARACATAAEWRRTGRYVLPDAQPIIILWPFGPTAHVYDVEDTGPVHDRAAVGDPFAATIYQRSREKNIRGH